MHYAHRTRSHRWRRYNGYRPPLPATVVEFWHSEISCSATAWVGQVGGRTLTGANTPTVAADGTFFRGRPVAQATATGTKNWRNASLGTVLASGTRPWAYVIGRFRSTAGTTTIASYGRPAGSHDLSIQNVSGAPAIVRAFFFGTAASSSPTANDTNPHRFKAWLDGTNANLTVDTTNYTAATAASLAGNVPAVSVGINAADGSTGGCDCSVAFYLLCSAKPSAAEEAALDAWASAYWGV